ncbi:MAG: recombinase family protein [Chitinivibrionales bacterium]|nr:recombinase family protein [Chitinivibrionales bacterium]
MEEALSAVGRGDTLMVPSLERLTHSVRHMVETVLTLHRRGVRFVSLKEEIDTATPAGADHVRLFEKLSEHMREALHERMAVARAVARSTRRTGGRPTVMPSPKNRMAREMLSTPGIKPMDVCKALKISRATLYRHVDVKGIIAEKVSGAS